MAKDQYCFYCDEIMLKPKITTDHIIPRMLGGTNHEKNKCKACLECNSLKANYLPVHLAELIEWFYIPRAETKERVEYLRKIARKCKSLTTFHIPRYRNLMIRKPFQA